MSTMEKATANERPWQNAPYCCYLTEQSRLQVNDGRKIRRALEM